MKFTSVAKRIFILVVPAIVITTVSFVVLSYNVSKSQINETINEKMYESLQAADLAIQLELYKNAAVALSYANYGKTLTSDTFDHSVVELFLTEGTLSNEHTFGGGVWFEPYALNKNSYYFGPFVYSGDNGEIVYVSDYGDVVDYFNEDWYLRGVESGGELVWSDVYYDPVAAITMVTATKPFLDASGKFMGVGTADMNLENIRGIVNDISVGETGKAFILGSNGEYISFYDEEKSVSDTMQTDRNAELARLGGELQENRSGITTFIRNGKSLKVYYMTMPNVDWTLAVTIEEREINSSAMNSFIVMTIIPIAGLLLVIFGIFMIIAYLRRIVSKVNNFADLAASGDFSKRIDVTEIDEFGFMEQRLNIMISNMDSMSKHSAELLQIAENASNSKSEFLSRMSHEIRTPMNAIIGMTQIAKSSSEPVKISDCLSKIDNASKHLLGLINDILDMSKIEANKLELSEEIFSPEHTLAGIHSMMLVKAEEKNQKLTLNIDKSTPAYIVGDQLRLSQVITNLIGNAVKFTPENGNISIDVCEIERHGDYSEIKISIKDSGIGISPEQQANLFKSFEQGDGSISRKFGGTGLGLAISKRIAEMMDGGITVTSELGKGSVFSFTFKALRSSGHTNNFRDPQSPLNNDELKSLKILAADNSDDANDYLKHVLNSLGLSCVCVPDGHKALDAAEKAAALNHPYDIVFINYILPDLNGIETAKRIKKISNKSIPIITVSIYDFEKAEPDIRNADISKYISKPFSPSSILDTISEITYGKIKNTRLKSELPVDFGDNTILIAEDIEINREIVAALLESTKVNIEFAENGIQAVEMFRLAPNKYDLILMDIQMPEMDGFEATKQIRQTDITRAKVVPIIAMTANALSEDVKKCKASGMNDHLAKPIDPDALRNKLNDYFFMKDYLNMDIG